MGIGDGSDGGLGDTVFKPESILSRGITCVCAICRFLRLHLWRLRPFSRAPLIIAIDCL